MSCRGVVFGPAAKWQGSQARSGGKERGLVAGIQANVLGEGRRGGSEVDC